MRNSPVPRMKTISITSAYASSPKTFNGSGFGGIGGGFGHESSQSTHEHAGVLAFNALLHGTTSGSRGVNPLIVRLSA